MLLYLQVFGTLLRPFQWCHAKGGEQQNTFSSAPRYCLGQAWNTAYLWHRIQLLPAVFFSLLVLYRWSFRNGVSLRAEAEGVLKHAEPLEFCMEIYAVQLPANVVVQKPARKATTPRGRGAKLHDRNRERCRQKMQKTSSLRLWKSRCTSAQYSASDRRRTPEVESQPRTQRYVKDSVGNPLTLGLYTQTHLVVKFSDLFVSN